MKVCLQYKSGPKTGKGHFALRLAGELKNQGIKIVDNKSNADIDLQFGKRSYDPNAKKSILRLGPAHIDLNQEYPTLNRPKWKSAKQSDGVIYQSTFSKKICHRFLGKPKGKEIVIFNGAPNLYLEGTHNNIVASTRKWIPQKRLKHITKAFISADTNVKLYITGNTLGQKVYHDRIIYTGILDQKELHKLYANCKALVHIVYVDACPNSVVEAKMAGLKVISTDQAGTKEILDDNDIIIKDKTYNLRPVNLSKPPKPDINKLAKMIEKCASEPYVYSQCDHLNIKNIAAQYISFFEEVLSGK